MQKTIILNQDCVKKVLKQFGYHACLNPISSVDGFLEFETTPPDTYQMLSFPLNKEGCCIYNSLVFFILTRKFPTAIDTVNKELQKCA